MLSSDIPVIDFARLDTSTTRASLDRACREWGFFQILGHGIDAAVRDDLQAAMEAFFAEPTEFKHGVLRTAENPWGFYDQELTKNTLDWKEIYDIGPPSGSIQPQWPTRPAGFQRAVTTFFDAATDVAATLLGAISRNLGMAANHLQSAFEPHHSSFLRLNYYPVCAHPADPQGLDTANPSVDGYLGINHHTDAGALTVLMQDDVPGLQVFKAGSWHTVPPNPEALVINIGDIVQVWSNDRYPAPLHRVLANPSVARYSAPYFFNPAYEADYAPLPSLLENGETARYRRINWGEFRAKRAEGDFADYGNEVQIADYRIVEKA